MLVAYLDESGTAAASPTLWLAGYVAHAATWFEVSRLWRHALGRAGVPSLHMVDLAAGRKAFKEWDSSRRRDLLAELIDILEANRVVGVGAGVEKVAYQRAIVDSGFLSSSQLTKGWWKTPYLIAFQDVLVECLTASEALPKSETLSVVVENQPEFSGRARLVFEQVRDKPHVPGPNRLASISFASKTEAIPLQAADLLAYELRKGHHQFTQSEGRPPRVSLQRLGKRVRSSRVHDAETLALFIESYHEVVARASKAF